MITIFRTFYDQTPYHIPIDKALQRLRDGVSKNLVEQAQLANDPKDYANLKKKLPCLLFSGKFSARNIAGLTEHSGFICLDFDKFPNGDELQLWRDNLESDSYTYSVFTSPSGRGLKCLVKIPPTDYRGHKAYFRGLQDYYDCEYFDLTVFDVSRICFESYDPELQINLGSELWIGQIFDPEPVMIEYNKASLDDQETVRRLLVWSNNKFPITSGQRNSNLFRLCCCLKDFGIEKDYAMATILQFQSDDFRVSEITTTLNSAYKRPVPANWPLKF